MTSPRPVSISTLPEPALTAAEAVVEIPMTAHDRRRVRRLVEAPDGVLLALELPTGTVLHPGQLLHHTGSCAYVVTAAPEEVIVIRPGDIAEAARMGHLVGNLHRDIDVQGTELLVLADPALTDRLVRMGVSFEVDRRAFHGRAAGGHSH